MKFKKIVGFGDSWMYGDELLDPTLVAQHPDAHSCWTQNSHYRQQHCFLGQLGEHYGVPTENFGIPGGSITSAQWTFQWWLDHETLPLSECLVLVGLPIADRLTFYNPNHVHYGEDPKWNMFLHSSYVEFGANNISREWRDMVKQCLVLSSCESFNQLNYQNGVLFFDGVACRNNVPMLQFNILPAPRTVVNVPTLPWPDHNWVHWFRDHPQNQKRQLLKPMRHPNEIGHTYIRDRLISYIDSCII
jgi:hypothetical protein